MDRNDFIAVGKIVKPIGLKGNLKVFLLTDFPERFRNLKELYLFDENGNVFFKNELTGNYKFKISECSVNAKFVNLKFEGYSSIEETRELINLFTLIEEKDKIKISKDDFYYYEMIGLNVFDKGKLIGEVIAIEDYGSGDLFRIRCEDKEIYVPFRKEFIKKIDIGNKRIDTELIDGFL